MSFTMGMISPGKGATGMTRESDMLMTVTKKKQ